MCLSTSLNYGFILWLELTTECGRCGIIHIADLGFKRPCTLPLSRLESWVMCWRTNRLEQAELPQVFWPRPQTCGEVRLRSVMSFSPPATDCWLTGGPHQAQFRSAESPSQPTDSWAKLYIYCAPLRYFDCMLHSIIVTECKCYRWLALHRESGLGNFFLISVYQDYWE